MRPEFEEDDSVYGLFNQIIRYHFNYTHNILEKVGIYPGQPPLLFNLAKNEGLSQKELAEQCNIRAATITVMLKRMEKAGLVVRRPDEHDQRISRVYLTPKGEDIHKQCIEAFDSVEGVFYKDMSEDELMLLRRLLMQVRNNLKQERKGRAGKNI